MPDQPTPWHLTNPAVQSDPQTGVPPTTPNLDLPMDPFGGGSADTPWQPPQWTRPNLGGGYPAALDDSRREIVIPAADGPVTIAYGRVRIAPVVELLHTHIGHFDYAVLVWGLGEIDAVEEVSFGADAGSDVDGNGLAEPTILASYTGSLTQTVSSHLTALASGLGTLPTWPFAMPGKAYSVARASEGQDLSLINSARAIVRGLKVYDPRVSSGYTDRRYSRDPCLFAGSLFACEWGMKAGYDAVHWDRIGDAADYCATNVAGEPRFAVDVWIRQGMTLKTILNTLAVHCRGYWGRDGGRWYFDIRRPKTSTFVFSDRLSRPTIAPESVQVSGRNRAKEPSSVMVDWLDPESWKTGVPVVVPNPRSTVGIREARVQLPWCTSRSMARRIGVYELGQRTRHPAKVSWTAPDAAQAVQVGDVVTLDVDGLLDQVEVEVEQVRRDAGSIQFVGTGYSGSKFGDVTEIKDIRPVIDVPGMGSAPDLPTSVNQSFVELGNWSAHTLLPNPDNLSGWTRNADCLLSYDGTRTRLYAGGPGPQAYYDVALSGYDSAIVTFLAKSSTTYSGVPWYFDYLDTGTGVGDAIAIQNNDSIWRRYVVVFPVNGASGGPHRMRFSAGGLITGDDVEIREIRVVGWSFRAAVSLLENWTWTEHPNASNTVRRYELVRKFSDGRVIVLAAVPVGSTSIHAVTFGGGGAIAGGVLNVLDESIVTMRAVGRRGRMVEFGPSTQSVAARELGDVVGDLRDFDETDIGVGKLVVVQADAKTKGYIAQGSGGGLDADTLDGVHLSGVALASHNHDGTYLGLTAKAADSDKLDGLDSTAFSLAAHNHSGVYAPLSHTHDDRYFTETEINARLSYPKAGYYGEASGRWSLIASVTNTDGSKFRVKLYGTHFNLNYNYMQELVFACRTLGSGSPTVHYTHIGSVYLLRAGIQIYTTDGGATFDIYAWSGQYGNMAFIAEKCGSAVWSSLNPGSWTATAPSGTKVFDSTDHSTYPPVFRAASEDTRPYFKGSTLALSSDLSSYSLTTHDHDATYIAKQTLTAKGSLISATAYGTPANLSVGANNYVLLADSAQTTGLKWGTLVTASIGNDQVTYEKIQNVAGGSILGRYYGSAAGDVTEMSGSEVTKIGTGGNSGQSQSSLYFAALAASGSSVVGRHTLTFTNGWLTGYSYLSFV